MAKKPILFFPRATDANFTKSDRKTRPPVDVDAAKQGRKFKNDWKNIADEFNSFHLAHTMGDSVPEMVLVLELKGTVDEFYKAVQNTESLQFLGHEFDFTPTIVENAPTREDDNLDPEYPNSSRVFLTLQNESSLNSIQSQWDNYVAGNKPGYGVSKFRDLFMLLDAVRLYSVEDRIRDTGFREYIDEMAKMSHSPVLAEVELLFITKSTPKLNKDGSPKKAGVIEQGDAERTAAVYQRFRDVVARAGGSIINDSYTLIPQIHYHAVAAMLPLELVRDLSSNTEVELLKAPEVLFFRPLGQSSWTGHPDEDEEFGPEETQEDTTAAPRYDEPIAALLDGLPIQNHAVLAGRLTVDSEGVDEGRYSADQRHHGTAMATLITRGDLSDSTALPLHNKLYVRPIMVPEQGYAGLVEQMPSNKLPIDVIHRAVRRLFVGEAGEDPVAPNVRIINLSIGDISRPFHHSISAWARLLDWLADEHQVLFIVSAGNVGTNIELPIAVADFDKASPEDREKLILSHIVSDNLNRKVLTPSEAINVITVGASQADAGPGPTETDRYTLINDAYLTSPISRIGFGYRGSIKPDVLFPGGRKCYRKQMIQPNAATSTALLMENFKFSHRPPGIKVAIPGPANSLSTTGYQWGTSSATALATRLACQLHEMLDEVNMDSEAETEIPYEYFTVLIKALLVHGAGWQQSSDLLHEIVSKKPGVPPNYIKKHVTPYLGYGVVNGQRVLSCTDSRVTLLGWGELELEKAHEFLFPLPEALGKVAVEKRLTTTLAWISPTNWQSRQYRQAKLYVDNITGDNYVPKDENLTLRRDGIDWNTTRRGTVQHDVLVGHQAEPLTKKGNLVLKVDCRKDAPGLEPGATIRYGLAVTLEVNESDRVKIYEEVRQKLKKPIRPRP
ncbi:MAG: S8 family peptidase [Janthinobacterium lividum]